MAQKNDQPTLEKLSELHSGNHWLVFELLGFLMDNKKWWLIPLLLVLLGLSVFTFLSGTAAAPFIYTLF